eukprot:scaffold56472_cov69-Phaeocystis_antarctica.AAC.1
MGNAAPAGAALPLAVSLGSRVASPESGVFQHARYYTCARVKLPIIESLSRLALHPAPMAHRMARCTAPEARPLYLYCSRGRLASPSAGTLRISATRARVKASSRSACLVRVRVWVSEPMPEGARGVGRVEAVVHLAVLAHAAHLVGVMVRVGVRVGVGVRVRVRVGVRVGVRVMVRHTRLTSPMSIWGVA